MAQISTNGFSDVIALLAVDESRLCLADLFAAKQDLQGRSANTRALLAESRLLLASLGEGTPVRDGVRSSRP